MPENKEITKNTVIKTVTIQYVKGNNFKEKLMTYNNEEQAK